MKVAEKAGPRLVKICRSFLREDLGRRVRREINRERSWRLIYASRLACIVKTDPALRVRRTLETSRGHGMLEMLVQQEIEALTRLSSYVDEERLAAAAAALSDRRRIFIFARGNAETLAVLMNRRLRRMAFETVLVCGDSRDIAEQILSMGPDDALLVFAFRRQPRAYAPLIERAGKVGAVSVVVSGTVGPSLSPKADHLLAAPRAGDADAFQTLTVPMAICNGLILSMAQSDEVRSLSNLEQLGELIGELEGR